MRDVAEYLARKGIEYSTRDGQAIANCPFCEDRERKFSINLESGLWQCFHKNNCGKSGTFWTLQKELGDEPEGLHGARSAKKKAYRRPEAVGAKRPDHAVEAWFRDRKIMPDTIRRFRIGLTQDGRIAFPYHKDGELINVKYRKLPKSFSQEKDAEPCLFGHDLVPQSMKELYIVEGELDAMAMWEYEIPAVSVPSGAGNLDWIETEWDFLLRFEKIFLMLDNDKAGSEAAAAIAKRIGWTIELRRVELPFKDANDCLVQGVNRKELMDYVIRSKLIKPNEVKSLRQVDEEQRDRKPAEGVPIGITGLDDLLRGWRPSELTVWGGRDGSGKTTLLNQIGGDLLVRRQRLCVASLEMGVRSLVACMVSQLMTEWRQFVDHYGDSLYFVDIVGEVNGDKLLAMMQYAAKRHNVRHFIVDSLGRIAMTGSEGENYWLQQKSFVNKLLDFVAENDAHVHLVNHMRKGKSDDDPAGKEDLEGSGWVKNLAHNVVLVRRIRPSDRARAKGALDGIDAIARVAKNREHGREGEVMFSFNEGMKRFNPPVRTVTEEASGSADDD